MKDRYNTILSPAKGEFKDRGSKFLAYAFPVKTEQAIGDCQEEVRKEHPKARHHCYAWRLGTGRDRYRFQDDGEPSGTAGKPILGQIDKWQISDILVIVVRYFGGTLLGTSGLINAYRESTVEALSRAVITETIIYEHFRLSFEYSLMSDVMNALKKLNIIITKQEFTNAGLVEIDLPAGNASEVLLQMKSLVYHISLEEAVLVPQKDILVIEPIS